MKHQKTVVNNSWTKVQKAKTQVEYTEVNKRVKNNIGGDKWKYVKDSENTEKLKEK